MVDREQHMGIRWAAGRLRVHVADKHTGHFELARRRVDNVWSSGCGDRRKERLRIAGRWLLLARVRLEPRLVRCQAQHHHRPINVASRYGRECTASTAQLQHCDLLPSQLRSIAVLLFGQSTTCDPSLRDVASPATGIPLLQPKQPGFFSGHRWASERLYEVQTTHSAFTSGGLGHVEKRQRLTITDFRASTTISATFGDGTHFPQWQRTAFEALRHHAQLSAARLQPVGLWIDGVQLPRTFGRVGPKWFVQWIQRPACRRYGDRLQRTESGRQFSDAYLIRANDIELGARWSREHLRER